MRILNYEDQNTVYKALVEIIKVLVKSDDDNACYALSDVYTVARVVGGKRMLIQLEGGEKDD